MPQSWRWPVSPVRAPVHRRKALDRRRPQARRPREPPDPGSHWPAPARCTMRPCCAMVGCSLRAGAPSRAVLGSTRAAAARSSTPRPGPSRLDRGWPHRAQATPRRSFATVACSSPAAIRAKAVPRPRPRNFTIPRPARSPQLDRCSRGGRITQRPCYRTARCCWRAARTIKATCCGPQSCSIPRRSPFARGRE